MEKKVCLVILDGWGIGKGDNSDAIHQAETPFFDSLLQKYPNAELLTDGNNVGLPKGQMGNSEVGHMNIGAGRIVYQDLVRINKSIESGEFFSHPLLLEKFQKAKSTQKKVHFMGLLGEGGVHASQQHLVALCKLAHEQGLENVYIHGFTDGRDTDPRSGLNFVRDLERDIAAYSARMASLVGRYYAMDRDKRWERVRKAYDLLVHGKGSGFKSAEEAIEASYAAGITDEFMEPAFIAQGGEHSASTIEEGDLVVCFNFRTDRCREITEVLTQRNHQEQLMSTLDLDYVTMTVYDETFKGVDVLFTKQNIDNTMGEYLSKCGKTQLRMAETEKYPHVSFFFSGGQELEFEGETRQVIASPKVATYDLQPEMSAFEVRDSVCQRMLNDSPDFICLNFANADMVGHTGVYQAIVEACEAVDSCLEQVVETGMSQGYKFVIIADHGNADFAVNADGSPNTAHSLNPVPVVVIDDEVSSVQNGILADVSPSILHMMGLEQPAEMTGVNLVS